MVDILIVGLDSRLLETRKWLLEAEGYRVHTTNGLTQLEDFSAPIRLLILCHTVPYSDAKLALQVATGRWPCIPRIVLMGVGAQDTTELPSVITQVMDGPASLIATVKRLLDA